MSEISGPKLSNDVEKAGGDYAHLTNKTIRSFGWESVTVNVNDRETKQPKTIVSNVSGVVQAGKCHCAEISWKALANCYQASRWLLWVHQAVERQLFSMSSPTAWPKDQQMCPSLFTLMEARPPPTFSKR